MTLPEPLKDERAALSPEAEDAASGKEPPRSADGSLPSFPDARAVSELLPEGMGICCRFLRSMEADWYF